MNNRFFTPQNCGEKIRLLKLRKEGHDQAYTTRVHDRCLRSRGSRFFCSCITSRRKRTKVYAAPPFAYSVRRREHANGAPRGPRRGCEKARNIDVFRHSWEARSRRVFACESAPKNAAERRRGCNDFSINNYLARLRWDAPRCNRTRSFPHARAPRNVIVETVAKVQVLCAISTHSGHSLAATAEVK